METGMPLMLSSARHASTFAALGVAATMLLAAGDASALTKQECIQASERGQQFRDEGKLAESRQQLLLCVQESCPRPVADACREDLASVEKRLPTVVLSAKAAAGTDLVDVSVQIDGVVVTQKLDGRAVPMNPGPHKVRMETAGQVVEEQVVVIEGEKSRPVRLTFPGPAGSTPPAAGATMPPTDRTENQDSGIHPAVWIFGGLAVASVGAFAFLGLKGKGEIDDLRATCAPNCAQDDVDAAKSKLLIGDIFLGVGIVSAGAATYFALAPRKDTPVTIGARGLGLELRGKFH